VLPLNFAVRPRLMLRGYVALVLLSAPAAAADFRTLDLGDACGPVQVREKALGSVAIPWPHWAGADIYAFTGRDFDRALTFTYFCTNGRLYSGAYYFPVETLDDAFKTYRAVYESLRFTYGDPSVEDAPWQTGPNSNPLAMPAENRAYTTAWKTPRLDVNMGLASNYPSERPGRRVVVGITQRKN
jgi:hypothetical protein